MSLAGSVRAGRAFVEITAETNKLRKGLGDAKARLEDFSHSVASMGAGLAALGTAAALPFALSAKSFAGFDDRMRMVSAVTGAADDQFKRLTRTAQKLGRETSFTAQQVADAMTAMGRMGFRPGEIDEASGAVLDLARSTGTDLPQAADIAANSMRIFGMSAADMAEVADLLTATANGSAQTLEDLFEGLKIVGPQAKAAGEDLRETCAALGVLANVGVKGSLAGTALRKSFVRFADAGVQKQLAELGIVTIDANGNLLKTADIMTQIARAMARMPTARKLSFAQEIFDIRGALAGLSIGGNIEELDRFLDTLQDVDGAAATTAKRMDEGLGGSFRLLQSAAEGSMNAVGDAVVGTLQPMTDYLTAAINASTGWIEANRGVVTAIAATAAGTVALGTGLMALGVITRGAAAGAGALRAAFSGISKMWSALATAGHAVTTSMRLVSGAFSAYADASIPALVGTSRLLAALNLPLDSRAKQVAASLVLMSNAEAAAAAKTAITTRYAAACTVLGKFKAATIASAVATKAHAVAEVASGVATKALAVARGIATAATKVFTWSTLKATAASFAANASNIALAAGAKLVAGGYLAASAAASAFCAIPIVAIVVALVGGLVVLTASLAKSSRYVARLTEAAQKMREEGDKNRKTDELRMERLRQLAGKQNLSNREMEEAGRIANILQSRYGDLGISVDAVAGRIDMATDAQKRFSAAMKAAALAQVEAEILEITHNISELEKESDSMLGFWVNAWNTISFRMGKASDDIAANGKKIEEAMLRLRAAKARKSAIEGDEEGSLTGDTDENEALEKKISEESERVVASKDDAERAGQRAAEIEQRLERERRTSIENEIADIRALRDEYKGLVRTMLEYERSKASPDKNAIAALEAKLDAADRDAAKREKAARDKDRDRRAEEAEEIRLEFERESEDVGNRRDEEERDRGLVAILQADRAKGLSLLENLVAKYTDEAAAAKQRFETAFKEATSDGSVSDTEAAQLDLLKEAYAGAEALVDKYAGQLRDARESPDNGERSRSVGSFYASALEAFGAADAGRRTATATEQTATATRRILNYLRSEKTTSGAPVFS